MTSNSNTDYFNVESIKLLEDCDGLFQLRVNPEASLDLHNLFISASDSSLLFDKIKNDLSISWMKEFSRFTYFCGGSSYQYGDVKHHANLFWQDYLIDILKQVNEKTGRDYKSVLINHYKDNLSQDNYHKDDESSIDKSVPVGVLSLGSDRTFRIKCDDIRSNVKGKVYDIILKSGSFLSMLDNFNSSFLHSILKSESIDKSERISLTFRKMLNCKLPYSLISESENSFLNIITSTPYDCNRINQKRDLSVSFEGEKNARLKLSDSANYGIIEVNCSSKGNTNENTNLTNELILLREQLADISKSADNSDLKKIILSLITPFIEKKMQNLIDIQLSAIQKRITNLENLHRNTLNMVNLIDDELKFFVDDYEKKMLERNDFVQDYKLMKQKIDDLESCFDDMKSYSQRLNILFYGFKEFKYENTDDIIMKFCSHIGYSLSYDDFHVSHRFGKFNRSLNRPIIVRFISLRVKNWFISRFKSYKLKCRIDIDIREHLSPTNYNLMRNAINLKRNCNFIKYVDSYNGTVSV